MRSLHSIAPIEKKYETNGSKPFLILADDFEYYVCKYPQHPHDHKLVNEFLGQRFALEWGIRVPELIRIQIAREHIPERMLGDGLNYINLQKPIIGFKLIPDALEFMDHFASGIEKSELKKYDRAAFLTVALFDCWLSNDDRNHNNTNLFISFENNEYKPIAFDHEAIFNTSNLSRGIFEQSYQDSLLYSQLYHRLLPNSEKSREIIKNICASLHDKVSECGKVLDDIVEEIPEEWLSRKQELRDSLAQYLFTEEWLKSVENTYRTFASLTLKP